MNAVVTASVLAILTLAFVASVNRAWPRPRPVPVLEAKPSPVRIDPHHLTEQLADSIVRHPNHAFGLVRQGTVTVTALWVEDSWRDRWMVTIRAAGQPDIKVVPTYTDEAMYQAVLAELQHLAGDA